MDAMLLRRAKVVLIPLLIATVVGCGSAGHAHRSVASTSSPAARESQHLSFAAQAEAICRRLTSEFNSHPPKNSSVAEIARVSPGRAVKERQAVEELRRLDAHTSDQVDWRKLLSYRDTLASELAAVGAAAQDHDSEAVQQLASSKLKVHKLLRAAAARIKLSSCGGIS